MVTVDLGSIQEVQTSSTTIKSSPERPTTVLSMLYKKTEEPAVTEEPTVTEEPAVTEEPVQTTNQTPSPSFTEIVEPPSPATYSGMSVTELRQLLKEKYKQNPEKHAEIQKLKKVELIYALQKSSSLPV